MILSESRSAMKRAYARLERLTPLPVDCGELCAKRCCTGNEGDGMILFPGEELSAPFTVIDSDIFGYPILFASCPGTCKRETRPLSCRIFPFAPYLDAEKGLSIIPDPRAKRMCPLLAEDALPLVNPNFLDMVKSAFLDLLDVEGVRPMLESYTKMLDAYKRWITGF